MRKTSVVETARLYVIQARDETVRAEDQAKLTDAVRTDLLKLCNPEKTKGLQSFLPLHQGMRLLLSSKDCVRLGIMKGVPQYFVKSSFRSQWLCHTNMFQAIRTI